MPTIEATMPPLPPSMLRLRNEATRPIHLSRGDVARLLEHWGFTANGNEFIKKLERNGLLNPIQKKAVKKKLYLTGEVLGLYEDA